MPRRWYWVLAGTLLLLASALRFYHLGHWSIWIDEGATYLRAISGRLGDQGPLYTTAPLNFLLTRAVILTMSPTLFWLRFVPAVAGILGVAAMLWAGMRIGGPITSLVAGAYIAISPWHIDWSQNARHFSLVFLFATLGMAAFYLFWESGRYRYAAAAGLCVALGLATHSSSAFVLGAMGVYSGILLLDRRRQRAVVTSGRVIGAAVMAGVVLTAYIPVVIAVSRYLAEHKAAWNPPGNVAASIVFYLGPATLIIALGIAAIGVAAGSRRFMLGLAWLVTPIVLVTVAAKMTIASGAYALPAEGGAALLIGLGAAAVWERRERVVRLGGATVLAGIFAGVAMRTALFFTTEHGNRPPWRETADWLEAHVAPGEPVYSDEGISVTYYTQPAIKAEWLDGWTPAATAHGPFWIALLAEHRPGLPAALKSVMSRRCTLERVFYRNTGPKRRDIEIYHCDGPPSAAQ